MQWRWPHLFFSPSTEHWKHPWAEIGNIDPWKPLDGQTDSEVDTSWKLKSTFYSVSPGLGCTCNVLRYVWSRSNLHTSRGTFFTVWPPNVEWRPLVTTATFLQWKTGYWPWGTSPYPWKGYCGLLVLVSLLSYPTQISSQGHWLSATGESTLPGLYYKNLLPATLCLRFTYEFLFMFLFLLVK